MLRVLALALAFAGAACRAASERRFEFEHTQMGALFKLVFYARDDAEAEHAARDAFARLDELNLIFSDYEPESELSRLSERSSGAAPTPLVPISRELFDALSVSRSFSEASGGAFDITVGPLTRAWRRAVRQHELPEPETIGRALASVGWRNVELDATTQSVRLLAPDMRLDLGGIAVGIALDELGRLLAARGIERILIDGGGDILAGAPPPGRTGWRVAIRSLTSFDTGPGFSIEIARAAVSTSGDTYRFVELDGVRYSHIVDPRTGRGLTTPTGAAVVASNATAADALSTAACVLGPEEAVRVLARISGVEAHVIARRESGVVACDTPGFSKRIAAP